MINRIILFFIAFFASAAWAAEPNTKDDSYTNETENLPLTSEIDQKGNKSIFDVIFSKSDLDKLDDEDNEKNITIIEESNEGSFVDIAVVKVIDRTLGKLYLLEIPLASNKSLNELTIGVHKCWNPTEVTLLPKSRALIEINENVKGAKTSIFHGWMLANHPSAAYLEHAKYDISLKLCKASEKKSSNIDNKQ